jgi:protein phosphatase
MVDADGLGCHAAGDDASSLAVSAVIHYILDTMTWFFRLSEGENDLLDELQRVIARAQRSVADAAEKDPARRGMGTTLTMAYVLWPRMYVLHIGDTRCYVFRGGKLEQVTTDHTLAQLRVAEGMLSPKEAAESQLSHVLLRAIGHPGEGGTRPDAHKLQLEPGEGLLLCSDGLTRHVPEDALARMMDAGESAADTCTAMIEAANAAGGEDNITAVVAFFMNAPEDCP